MPSRRKNEEQIPKRGAPATTPEERENELIAYAVDLAEKQLREGTASSQTLSHFLKMGSSREKLEQERLAEENNLLRIRAEAIASAKRVEELYKVALDAMRSYAGQEPLMLEDDYDD